MAKNNLGQPTISDVTTFFCDPCNAVLCAGCPVNDILQAEKAAQPRMKADEATRHPKSCACNACMFPNINPAGYTLRRLC